MAFIAGRHSIYTQNSSKTKQLKIYVTGSIHGLAGIPSIFMPTLMQWRGRKFAFITACLASIIGWILSYLAQTSTVILIAESFHGFGSNSIYAVSCLSIIEMMAPKHRDTFIQLYYIFLSSAMALNGLLVQYLHWKTISIIMSVPMILAVLLATKWPESPYWLAYKSRYSKCEESFKWLRGDDAVSNRELKELINAQKCIIKKQKFKEQFSVRRFFNTITSRDFYIPLSHIFVLEYVVQGVGFIIVLIYSIELFNKASNNNPVALYGSFIVNILQFCGIIISIILSRLLKRKTLLLTSLFSSTTFLISASVICYLQEISILSKDSLLSVYCLILYMACLSVGVVPMAYPIASALMPVKYKGIGGIFYVTNTCILHTLSLKVAPYLFLTIHLWGTFLIFALNGMICGLVIWRFVPETKDRSLQEIEDFYMNGKWLSSEDNNYNLTLDGDDVFNGD